MKNNWKAKIGTNKRFLVMALALGVAAAGFPAMEPAAAGPAETGKIVGNLTLNVIPKIRVGYDVYGNVVDLEGMNAEGRKVLNGYSGYKNRDCDDVLSDLIVEIYEDGYFQDTVGGQPRNVVIRFEKNSRYPERGFAEDIAEEVRRTVEALQIDSATVVLSDSDYMENGYIGKEQAKELVLAQLKLDKAEFVDKEYKLDDGVYEMEFTADGVTYEYEVDAITGEILEADREYNGDWDDSDSRYDMEDRDDDIDDDDMDGKYESGRDMDDDMDDDGVDDDKDDRDVDDGMDDDGVDDDKDDRDMDDGMDDDGGDQGVDDDDTDDDKDDDIDD